MPDLLTHVLWGYVIGTLLSFRYDWLDARFVTIVMLGALLPDLTKISLVVDDALVEHVLGIPFSWGRFTDSAGPLSPVPSGQCLLAMDSERASSHSS